MRETITRTKGSKERTLPKGSMDPPTEMTLFYANKKIIQTKKQNFTLSAK